MYCTDIQYIKIRGMVYLKKITLVFTGSMISLRPVGVKIKLYKINLKYCL